MVAAKMLYLIQNENEMSYQYGNDVAYCIAGKEVRILTPSGVKYFVLKQQAAQPQQSDTDTLQQRVSTLEKYWKQFGSKRRQF